ncbi:MAG: O-antigen ligase family protein [Candidatus Hinthialibacter antarcticus]|nr:O-antigen ligase family protein [Candidatus Hinthialibacter antarcticus]
MVDKALSKFSASLPPSQRWFEIVVASAIILLGLSMVWLFASEWALLGTLGALVLAICVLFGYEYFPLALFVTLPFSVEFHLSESTRLTLPTEMLIPLLVVLFAGECLKRGVIPIRMSWMNGAVLLFYFMMAASLLYTTQPTATLKAIIRDSGYILAGYYFIPRFVTSEARLKQLLTFTLAAHILLVLYGLGTQAVNGLRIYGDLAYPFFVEHCIYAAFITLTLTFLLAFMLEEKPGSTHRTLIALTGFVGFAVVLTFVRGAWISIFFVLLFYLYQFRHRKSSVDLILTLIYIALIGGVIVIGTGLGAMLMQRVETITDLQYVANYDRIGRWAAAFDIWQDHLWLGAGWGSYPDEYFNYLRYEDAYSAKFRMGAHNIYLELLAETGVWGLSVFLLMIYAFFRHALLLQTRAQSRFIRTTLAALQGAMITFIIHAFINNLGPSDKIGITFWWILGMIPAIQSLIEKEELPKSNTTNSDLNPNHSE